MGIAFQTVLIGAWVSLVAAVVGGLPIALAVLRGAVAGRRRDVLGLLGVPPLALVVFVGYSAFPMQLLMRVIGHRPVHDPINLLVALTWMGLLGLAALASAAALSLAVARSELTPGTLRRALPPGLALAATMGVVAAATLAWGLSLRAEVPELFNSNGGMLATLLPLSWLAVVVVMGLAAATAARSVVAGLLSR